MDTLSLFAALFIGLAIGALAAWQVASARIQAAAAREAGLTAQLAAVQRESSAALTRLAEVRADRDSLVAEFKAASLDSEQHRAKATERVLFPVRESLDRLAQRLTQVEKERAALSAELGAQVQSVRQTGEALRRETSALATALRKPQVRGAWGEMQLRRVVEVAGMVEHCDFIEQATTTGHDEQTIRPDMKVLLGEGRFVYVDSKVPLAAFLDAEEATDEDVRQACWQSFARNVRAHIDQLSGKAYYKADVGTPEFVVLFLPSEALAATALSLAPDLHDYAARRNIILATPSTLIALLRAVSYGWRQAALAGTAAEVFALGRELYDRLGKLGDNLDKLGRSLTASVKAYNASVGSLESRVFVSARKLHHLHISDDTLNSPAPLTDSVRPLSAPELVSDDGEATSVVPIPGEGGRMSQ